MAHGVAGPVLALSFLVFGLAFLADAVRLLALADLAQVELVPQHAPPQGTPPRPDAQGGTPEVSPGGTPEVSPGGTPEVSPGGTPEVSPGGTPEPSPGGAPEPRTGGTPQPWAGLPWASNLRIAALGVAQALLLVACLVLARRGPWGGAQAASSASWRRWRWMVACAAAYGLLLAGGGVWYGLASATGALATATQIATLTWLASSLAWLAMVTATWLAHHHDWPYKLRTLPAGQALIGLAWLASLLDGVVVWGATGLSASVSFQVSAATAALGSGVSLATAWLLRPARPGPPATRVPPAAPVRAN